MQKIVIVSTNNNPDYMFYAPYQERAWNKLGWTLCIMCTKDVNVLELNLTKPESIIIQLPELPKLRTQTIAQVGRLYAANYLSHDAMIMTCDIDLIPLSDYWHPQEKDVTVYGHDLTWFSFYPMGYIAMTGHNWKKYMNLTGLTKEDMLRDANDRSISHSPFGEKWEEWWDYDWDLVTTRLKPFEKEIKFINRGQVDIAGATLAKGRIDRYNIEATRNQHEHFIDMHYHNTSLRNDRRDIVFEEISNKFYP